MQSHGHDIWVQESTASRAIVKGRRKGSDRIESSTWTIDRAKQFKLTGKSNWQNQPTNMLLARATSECARLVAADVILGMPYSTEELIDGVDITDAAPVTEQAAEPSKRTAKRKPLERADTVEPDPDKVTAPAEVDDVKPVSGAPAAEHAADGPLTQDVTDDMAALFKQTPMTHVAEQFEFISDRLGRKVTARKQMTNGDGVAVVAALHEYIENNEPPTEEPQP